MALSTWTNFPTSLKEKIATLRGWLHTCETTHAECEPQAAHSLPSRLIDLRADGVDCPRLVSTASLPSLEIKYTTLSYCWGSEVPLRTTKATVETFHIEIPRGRLPKTFADAFWMTRELGIPYLWIDALCIIQDDKDDWRAEAAKMHDIYGGSSLTISASESRSAEGGFFVASHLQPIERPTNKRAFLSARVVETGSIVLILVVPDESAAPPALRTRGWAFQEAILSPRVVTVLNSELMWRCRTSVLSELGMQYREGTAPHRDVATFTEAHNGDWHRVWWKWMEDYTNRHFTYPEDRLPALLGVIDQYRHITRDIPVLGLWKSSLHKDIGWIRLTTCSERTPNGHPCWNMPSWSPFACDQAVEFAHWLGDELNKRPTEFCTEILDCEVLWTGQPYVSSIKSAHLTVLARLRRMYLAEAIEVNDCNPPYFNVENEVVNFNTNPLPWRCAVQWDKEGQRSPQVWLCMLLSTRQPHGLELGYETFLVLEEIHHPTYRRVGIGSLGLSRLPNGGIKKVDPKFESDVLYRITLV